MPDSARVWVFGAAGPLDATATDRLLSEVDRFLEDWLAHGHPVLGARQWVEDTFLFIAADEEATGVSGCSIDTLFRTLQGAESKLGGTLTDRSLVHYRGADGLIRSVSRRKFRDLVASGEATEETPVFDLTVSTVGAVRGGGWEKPLADSWHASAFAEPRRI